MTTQTLNLNEIREQRRKASQPVGLSFVLKGGEVSNISGWLDTMVNSTSRVIYGTSALLVAGNTLDFFDQHSWAFGAVAASLTYVTNLIFNILRLRSYNRALARRCRRVGD